MRTRMAILTAATLVLAGCSSDTEAKTATFSSAKDAASATSFCHTALDVTTADAAKERYQQLRGKPLEGTSVPDVNAVDFNAQDGQIACDLGNDSAMFRVTFATTTDGPATPGGVIARHNGVTVWADMNSMGPDAATAITAAANRTNP